MSEVFEFRGVDNLVFAEVLTDSEEEYTTGEVKSLAAVAEIGKTTESSSESHYYNNLPMVVVTATGPDEVTITCAPPALAVLAEITGRTYDETLGVMVEGERAEKYFAIGYRTKGTDGKYRYVWRYKGKFGIPEETVTTENDGTDTNNTELVYTGISTTHKFTRGGNARAMVVDTRAGNADVATFFDTVVTPDSIKAKTA